MNVADLSRPIRAHGTYWLTRFIILRWLGLVYLVGIVAVIFMPETKGKPLPGLQQRGH